MIYLAVFVVLALATARVTRVLVVDEVAVPFRSWVINKWGDGSKPAKLIQCYWCTGWWVACATCGYAAAAAVLLHAATLLQAAAVTLLLIPAVAYTAARILDHEDI